MTIPVFRPRGPSVQTGERRSYRHRRGGGAAGLDFPFEEPLDEVFPSLHAAQNAWLSQIDSLKAPDRKTHELIRLVCTVILRNPAGVRRHAMLAKEVGASWDEILGSIMLTLPGFGLLPGGRGDPARPRRLRRRARSPKRTTDERRRPVPDPAPHHRPEPALLDRRAPRASCGSCAARTTAPTCTRRRRAARSATARTSPSRRCRAAPPCTRSRSTYQPWMPGPEPPYVVAIVELPEQEGLRLTTNIVNCAARRRAHRHAGAGRLRAARRRRRVGVHPAVRAGGADGRRRPDRAAHRHQRRRAVRHRPPPATATRSTSRSTPASPPSRTPASPPTDIDGIATYPGADGHAARLLRRGRRRSAGRAAPRARLVHGRHRAARASSAR